MGISPMDSKSPWELNPRPRAPRARIIMLSQNLSGFCIQARLLPHKFGFLGFDLYGLYFRSLDYFWINKEDALY